MQLVRQLIYKEKTLDDFDIDSNKSVFKLFFDLLLNMDGTRVTDVDADKKITDMFNDACFISNDTRGLSPCDIDKLLVFILLC